MVAASLPRRTRRGQDSGANNGVVRTYDLFAVRVDWDVNEAASTDTTLTVTLPDLPDADLAWAPDASGMFAGCKAGSSISADGLTLICKLGDVAEGTHGDIRPVAKLMRGTNNTTFNVTATISDSSGAAVDSDTLDRPFTVSEVGVGNWVKNDPIFTPTPVTNSSGAEGYVVLFPIGLKAADQASAPSKGSGPISTGGTISFQDHAWDMAAGSRLATAAEITAAAASGVNIFGSACGAYDSDNAGAMPGETAGTWSCTAPTSPNGYPVWTMSVNGYTNIAPDLNANGSANNAGYIITGQVIMWMDKAAVEDAMAPQGADFHNTISTDPVGTNVAANQAAGIAPIGIPVSSGTLPESTTKDNTTKFAIATGTSGGGGGGPGEYTSHYGLFTSSIKDILYYEGDPGVLETYPQPQTYPTGAGDSWRGRGTVSRGTPIQMNLNVSTGSE